MDFLKFALGTKVLMVGGGSCIAAVRDSHYNGNRQRGYIRRRAHKYGNKLQIHSLWGQPCSQGRIPRPVFGRGNSLEDISAAGYGCADPCRGIIFIHKFDRAVTHP